MPPVRRVNCVPHREIDEPLECGRRGRSWSRRQSKALICSKWRAAPFQDGFRTSKRAPLSDSRSVANSKNASCSGLNLHNVDGRSLMQNTFPCHVHRNAHDWRQLLIFQGKTCSLRRAFTRSLTAIHKEVFFLSTNSRILSI